ncbi:hypothetical protein SEMRO_113_G056180.1 [Seminavis robusta]|uniref:Uncharacterized protein n=1 Tax=Seminavis robusta TaxID=568900 RepID=A0A9N8DFB2_9STRA|nr:hypothetical protein SEMRO_113_G056180.1 [Seminavis robusta]|eukprot:Sro113_g056180.1 n/a (134) ;mRNA; r:112403-112804
MRLHTVTHTEILQHYPTNMPSTTANNSNATATTTGSSQARTPQTIVVGSRVSDRPTRVHPQPPTTQQQQQQDDAMTSKATRRMRIDQSEATTDRSTYRQEKTVHPFSLGDVFRTSIEMLSQIILAAQLVFLCI